MLNLKSIAQTFCIITVIIYSSTPGWAQSKGGRWQFENNCFDTADWDVYDNSGTLQSTATFATQEPLQEGAYYLWLDSANIYDFVKIEDTNDLDFDNENIGISAWVYPIVVGDDVHWILNKGDQFTNPKTTNYSLRLSKSGNLEFLIRDSQNKAIPVASTFKISKDQWTFIAVFYDYNAKKISMWNAPTGEPSEILDFNQDYFSNNDPLAIGSWFSSEPAIPSVKDFEGRIDDVRISGRLEDILPGNTSVAHNSSGVALPVQMSVYPNPASLSRGDGVVTMQMDAQASGHSAISVYNVLGQKIFNSTLNGTGNYPQLKWNMRNVSGQLVNTGIYFIRFENMNQSITKKLVIVR